VSPWLDLYAWHGAYYPAGIAHLSPGVPVCPDLPLWLHRAKKCWQHGPTP
jgi:hypothetical protein